MIVFKTKPNWRQAEYFTFELTGTQLKVSYMKLKADAACDKDGCFSREQYNCQATTIVDFNTLFKPQSQFIVGINGNNSFCEPMLIDNAILSRDGVRCLANFYRFDSARSAIIYFDQTANDWLAYTIMPVDLGRDESTAPPVDINPVWEFVTDAILRHFPAYQAKAKVNTAKMNLLAQVDPNETLSYLEAQVDILTEVVKTLLAITPGAADALAQANPKFQEFLAKAETANVLSIKDISKCIEELDTKAKIRNIQQEYYKAKQ